MTGEPTPSSNRDVPATEMMARRRYRKSVAGLVAAVVSLASLPGGTAVGRTLAGQEVGTRFTHPTEASAYSSTHTSRGAGGAGALLNVPVDVGVAADVAGSGSIVFASDRNGDSQVFVMNADGAGLRQLTENGGDYPSWSPDGARIVFMRWDGTDWEVFVMNADGANQQQLTDNPHQEWAARWAPDGARIIFESSRGGQWKRFVMNADGADQQESADNDQSRRMSPDGARIVFSSHDNTDSEIFVTNADGANLRQLTDNTHRDEEPSWSPDGSRIVFTSDRDGDPEVFVMDADGANQRQLTFNMHSDRTGHSAWSPNRVIGPADLFDDVTDRHWQTVSWAVRNGIASGVSEHLFNPSGTVTRAQAVTFLYRAFPRFIQPSRSNTKGSDLFEDISAGHWADDAIGWAVDNNVISGSEGLFYPNQTLNRAHAVAVLYRAAARFGGPLSPSGLGSDIFVDVPAGLWADEAIGWAAANGVTTGVGHNTFDMHSKVTRLQMVTLLHRAITRLTTPRADPRMCRPPGVPAITAGFPLPEGRVQSTGTVRVAVLFVDFPDAQATHTTHQEAELGLPGAEKYLEAVSYGRLDVQFVAHHRWLRTSHHLSHYLDSDEVNTDRFEEEIARLADPEFDFTGYQVVMIIMPSTHFHGGAVTNRRFYTEEGGISKRAAINFIPRAETLPLEAVQPWSYIGAHEMAHTFGLLDMYPSDPTRHQRSHPPSGTAWIHSQFGAMGMKAYFPASQEDPRLVYEWRWPDGGRSTSYYLGFAEAFEMLSWSRWQLGWLKESQVRCVTEPQATITLSPVAAPGDGIAMIAIPVAETEVIVIESRRKLGYDTYHRDMTRTHKCPGPAGEPCLPVGIPALLSEGVLVYTVDTALGQGQLPLKVAGDTGNAQFSDYPILAQGQTITTHGYTISVDSTTQTTHIITITESSPTAGRSSPPTQIDDSPAGSPRSAAGYGQRAPYP